MTIMMRILMSIRDHDTDQVLEKSTLMSIYDGDPVEDPDKDPTDPGGAPDDNHDVNSPEHP